MNTRKLSAAGQRIAKALKQQNDAVVIATLRDYECNYDRGQRGAAFLESLEVVRAEVSDRLAAEAEEMLRSA